MGIIFGLYTLFFAPSKTLFLVYLLVVAFIAGYYTWRAEHFRWLELHVRLTPKFTVLNQVEFQPVITRNPDTGQQWESIWVQLQPKCLTDASIEDCLGHLRRVLKWNEERKIWQKTLMGETVPLGWSLAGDEGFRPIILEAHNEKRMNAFHVDAPVKVIIPTVSLLSSVWEKVYTVEDTFLFDIFIRGKDSAPVEVYLKVRWGDQWDKPTADIISKPDASILPA